MVDVMTDLHRRRQASAVFAGRHGFITPRDLFRWANRRANVSGAFCVETSASRIVAHGNGWGSAVHYSSPLETCSDGATDGEWAICSELLYVQARNV